MGRPAGDDFSVVEETANTLIRLLEDKRQRFSDVNIVEQELRQLILDAQIIAHKLPKLARVVNSRGFKFAVVAEDGTVRPATKDEAYRLIMGYAKEGGHLLEDIARATGDEWSQFLQWKESQRATARANSSDGNSGH